ncbi:MAG: glycosyltransferase [Oligosphaeraceae bacterium]
MNILQISTADRGGGAEGSAWNLHQHYLKLGHQAWLAVGQKFSREASVIEIPRDLHGPLAPLAQGLRPYARRLRGVPSVIRTLERLSSWSRLRQYWAGLDEAVSPSGCRGLAAGLPSRPEVIHCHNLHGWYFDLDALVSLSRQAPVILNLRDTWALTGHCAYFLDCDRWRRGCGDCPRLEAYPRCRRDRTRDNLAHKADVFRQSVARLVVPSGWLADCVRQSVLSALPCTVIPNGIETGVFRVTDGAAVARQRLGLPPTAPIVLFAAAPRASVFKDYETLWAAASRLLAARTDAQVCCLGIGRPPRMPLPEEGRLRCLPFVSERETLADYYRAADVFWHAANAEAFGKTVAEAMACGTPVIATPVGGITDQLREGENGFAATPHDPDSFVRQTLALLALPPEARQRLRRGAARMGQSFSLERQADSFLKLYEELLESTKDTK